MLRCTTQSARLCLGIAAANIEIKRSDVAGQTIHHIFDFDGEYHSKLDFAKLPSQEVSELMKLEVFLLDEVSMIDTECFDGMSEALTRGTSVGGRIVGARRGG